MQSDTPGPKLGDGGEASQVQPPTWLRPDPLIGGWTSDTSDDNEMATTGGYFWTAGGPPGGDRKDDAEEDF